MGARFYGRKSLFSGAPIPSEWQGGKKKAKQVKNTRGGFKSSGFVGFDNLEFFSSSQGSSSENFGRRERSTRTFENNDRPERSERRNTGRSRNDRERTERPNRERRDNQFEGC